MNTEPFHCREPRLDEGNPLAEVNIRRALWLTLGMMVIEISGGSTPWQCSPMAGT
jgi:hypothetical protein